MGHSDMAYKPMKYREIILQLVQLAIFFAFPTIWNWIASHLPWWPLDPDSTLSLFIYLVIVAVSWILGVLGIKKLIVRLRTQGLVV